jgi:hypothetical protein
MGKSCLSGRNEGRKCRLEQTLIRQAGRSRSNLDVSKRAPTKEKFPIMLRAEQSKRKQDIHDKAAR